MNIYPSLSDIVGAMQNPMVTFKSDELIGGTVLRKNNRILQYSGGYTTVFPFLTKGKQKVALRCWITDIGDAKRRSMEISAYLRKLNSNYFVDFKYLEQAVLIQGKFYPVVIMEWVEGQTLKDYINDQIKLSPSSLLDLASAFKDMVAYLHKNQIAHGDLQHGNLIIKPDGSITLIDYDSMYILPLNGMSDTIKGLPGYQHPLRTFNKVINSQIDFFSEAVIYVSLIVFAEMPDLWPACYQTEHLLFSKEDFENPNQSELFNRLSQSSNSTIATFSGKIKEQLAEEDIRNLLPLEELIIDKRAIALDNIEIKWGNQPNPPQKMEAKIPDIELIKKKM